MALVVVAVVCIGGGVAAYLTMRESGDTSNPPTPTPAPSQVIASPPAPKTHADCLVGDWIETSYAGTAEIYGTRVQLTSKGALVRFSPEGTTLTLYENLVRTGQADGNNYEVIHNGRVGFNFVADETTLHYSNPQVEGTTTWKVNGKVRDTEPMQVLLTPETYKCSGNQLRIFGDNYAMEYQRIVPPGVPV